MSGIAVRALVSVTLAGSMVLAGTAGTRASDGDRWDRDHRDHRHVEQRSWSHERWEHRHDAPYHPVVTRYVEAPPRVVRPQPVYVVPAPVPIYQVPAYAPPASPSLNFNVTIPLR